MQSAPAVFYEDTVRHVTIATHKQVVERAIQVMHTHLQAEEFQKSPIEEVFSFQSAMMVKYGPVKK
jgi:hypothetical protein